MAAAVEIKLKASHEGGGGDLTGLSIQLYILVLHIPSTEQNITGSMLILSRLLFSPRQNLGLNFRNFMSRIAQSMTNTGM